MSTLQLSLILDFHPLYRSQAMRMKENEDGLHAVVAEHVNLFDVDTLSGMMNFPQMPTRVLTS